MFPLASIAFIGGMVTGSFVGVVAHRVPRGRSIVGPRSECPSCGAQIAA
jgi:leader peptidase (prepilin peptidase) / N-methyltransferase